MSFAILKNLIIQALMMTRTIFDGPRPINPVRPIPPPITTTGTAHISPTMIPKSSNIEPIATQSSSEISIMRSSDTVIFSSSFPGGNTTTSPDLSLLISLIKSILSDKNPNLNLNDEKAVKDTIEKLLTDDLAKTFIRFLLDYYGISNSTSSVIPNIEPTPTIESVISKTPEPQTSPSQEITNTPAKESEETPSGTIASTSVTISSQDATSTNVISVETSSSGIDASSISPSLSQGITSPLEPTTETVSTNLDMSTSFSPSPSSSPFESNTSPSVDESQSESVEATPVTTSSDDVSSTNAISVETSSSEISASIIKPTE